MKKLILIILALCVTTSYAAIYMHEDESGAITYSDTPSKDAQKIRAPKVNSTPIKQQNLPAPVAPPTATSEASDKDNKPAEPQGEYTLFQIVSPKNQETIANQPTIPVIMKVEPPLGENDKIQLVLDEKDVGTASNSIYQELGLVERGTHTLYAKIIDKSENAIKRSNSVTFFSHRNSVLTNPKTRPN